MNIPKGSSFGENVRVHQNTVLSKVDVGSYTYIGGRSFVARCRLGNFCSIGPEVCIGLGRHSLGGISTYPGFYSATSSGVKRFHHDQTVVEQSDTVIGHDVWIGARVTIPGGVTIGTGAVIGAGSVVTKDVAPYTVVAGVPAKKIRKRFTDEEIDDLNRLEWWNKDEEFFHKYGELFMQPDDFFREFCRGE